MNEIDTQLRFNIIDDDFNIDNKCSFAFYDGVNFSGAIMNYNLSQQYSNGDEYERIYERNTNNKVTKVIIKFYEKNSDITYCCEKSVNSENIYCKSNDGFNEIISKEEYERFVIDFIARNNYSINEILENSSKNI